MAFCSNCGTELKDGVNFCSSCGKAVQEKAEESVSAGTTASAQENNDAAQSAAAPQAEAQQTNNTYYQPNNKTGFSSKLAGMTDTPDSTADYDQNDIAQNKVYAILSYISLLFLVPLLGAPNSKFARFHANQGIVLFIAGAALGIINTVFSLIFSSIFAATMFATPAFLYTIFVIINAFFKIVFGVVGLLILLLAVIGIINAAQGKAKELPLIGKIRILK